VEKIYAKGVKRKEAFTRPPVHFEVTRWRDAASFAIAGTP
jgi:hypothetical protein